MDDTRGRSNAGKPNGAPVTHDDDELLLEALRGAVNRKHRRALRSMHRSGRSDFSLKKLLKLAYPATLACAGLSTILSAGYVGTSLATDGLSGLDAAITAAAAISFFAVSAVLHHAGVHVLPTLNGERRSNGAATWFAATGLLIAVSFPTGVLFTGEPIAKAAQFENGVNTALEQASDAVAAAREVDALISPAGNAGLTAGGIKEREQTKGSISGIGGGTGFYTDTLATIETVTLSTEKALIAARASAAPLVRRINELASDIRKLVDEPDLSWTERSTEAKGKIVELTLTIEALQRTAPVESIRSLVDGLSKDWLAIGLNEQAASAIQRTFEPIATQFDLALADIRDNADRRIERFVEKTGFPLLLERAGEVFPIAVFVLLLDLLVVILVTLLLIIHRQPEDPISPFIGPDDDDHPPHFPPPAMKLLSGPASHNRGGRTSRGGRRANGRA